MPVSFVRRGLVSLGVASAVATAMVVVPVAVGTASAQLSPPTIAITNGETQSTSPTVEVDGTAAPDASIAAYDDGAPIATATADGSGSWSTYLDLPVSATAQSLTAVQTSGGEQSEPSSAVAITVTGNELVTNGSFEDPEVTGLTPCSGTLQSDCLNSVGWANFQGGAEVPGWAPTSTTNPGDTGNTCGIELETAGTVGVTPYDGLQYDELESNCVGGISQALQTVPGAQYVVSFAYMARPGTTPSENTIAVLWGGTPLAGAECTSASGQGCAGSLVAGSGLQATGGWTVAHFTVQATSSSTTLELDPTDPVSGDSTGAFLDDVSVVATSSPPATPTGVAAFPADGEVSLTWSEPTNPTGSQPTGYEVFTGSAPGAEGGTPAATSTTSATVSGLTDGTTYYFTVEAVNASGASGASSEVSATPNDDTNLSWLQAEKISLSDPPSVSSETGSFSQSLDSAGEALWYHFGIVPDEQVQVCLAGPSANPSALPGDYDISLFSDISQTFDEELSSTPNLAALGAETPGTAASFSAFSPSAFSPSAFSPSAFSPSAFSPSAFSPSAFSFSAFSPSAFSFSAFSPSAFSPSAFSPSAFSFSAFSPSAFSSAYSAAQIDSLLAVSSTPGPVSKCATADTWNNTGNFYVRVTGNNGAFAAGQPYTLTVTTSGSTCPSTLSDYSSDGFTTTSGDGTMSGSGSSPETVIVDNSSLMAAAAAQSTTSPGGTGALSSALQTLATDTSGVVVNVGDSLRVHDLYAQAQANLTCPYAENLEAGAIQDIINSYRTPSLRYVVIVGDDDVIPFFRYPDDAGLASESGYEPPLSSTLPPGAALASNDYLSDDQYGAASEITYEGTTIPLTTAAVGRLVETPADILATVDSYIGSGTTPGTTTIAAKSSLATGYDFMAPPATSVEQAFTAGGLGNDSLISNSWKATDLGNELFGSHHDLVFLGGHFSANNLLAADDTTTMTTNQFASGIGSELSDSLLLAAGCHAGYNIDGNDGVPGVTDPLAWPQAFTEAGATLIAGTGYQYGDTNYTAYSDQVYVDLAQQLGSTPTAATAAFGNGGGVAVGSALVDAEQEYLAGLYQMGGLQEKALLEIELYGLPMLGLHEPKQGSPANVAPTSTNPSLSTATAGPGAVLDLQQAQVDLTPTVTSGQNSPVASSGVGYTYDQGPQGVVADPGGPVLPLQLYDVNASGQTLRGVGFRSGTYTDTPGTNPLTGDPATDTGNPNVVPFASPVFFPQTLWNPNYFPTLDSNGDTELAVAPEQYVSDPGSTTTDTQRKYTDIGLSLYYSSNTGQYQSTGDGSSFTAMPWLAGPPTISNVTSTVNGNQVTVNATVTGDPSAGIQDVWVTYTGTKAPLYGSWQSTDLTQTGGQGAEWSGTFTDPNGSPASDAEFIVQAVNGVGEVSMDNNDGAYFTPSVTPGTATQQVANSYSLTLGGPSSGAYESSAAVTATLASLPAPAGSPPPATPPNVSGQTISFGIAGTTLTATTNSNGVATVHLPLFETPGSYQLSASYAGDTNDQPASATESFGVSLATTSLSLSAPSQITAGATIGVSATLTDPGVPLAQKTVYFVVSSTVCSQPTSVLTTSAITNAAGIAQPGPFDVPAGDLGPYTICAYFGSSSVPVPGHPSIDAADPFFGPSSSSSSSPVSVIDPPPTVTVTAPTSVTAYAPITYTATATNYGGSQGSPACNYAEGSEFTVGSVTITCSATAFGATGSASATVQVTPAPLTVSVSGSQTYGGSPSWSDSISGLVDGDASTVVTGTLTCQSTATPNSAVGSTPVITSCSGLGAPSYYSISYVLGTVQVTPAPLTITATSGTSTYGSTPPAVGATYAGFVNDQGASALATPPTCGTSPPLTSSSPAGTYVTTCSGAVDPNYSISYVPGDVVIGTQVLLVIASSASITYGQNAPSVTPTYKGLVNGDTITTPPTCSIVGPTPLTVGSWTTTCTGAVASSPSYTITPVSGQIEVQPAPLTITASSTTVTYGQAPPAITASYSGFRDNDSATSLTTKPTCSTTATSSSPLGNYPTSCSGAVDGNYTFAYVNGTVSVGPSTVILLGSGSGTLAVTGQSSFDVNGALAVNSSSSGSVSLSGQSKVKATGSLISPATNPVSSSGQSTASFASIEKLAAESDPDAGLAAPSTSGMTVYTTSSIQGPGVYTKAVSISGQSKVNLTSGVYVFDNGLTISGQAKVTNATGGVLFYFAGGSLTISGQSGATLTPLTSGTYQGILLFEARADSEALSLNGQSTASSLAGLVYAPGAAVGISGQSGLSIAALIASSSSVSGQGSATVG